jgi:branched-chain amino acid transport system ATP-binding protein
VKELKREGLCVILSEQNLNFARAIADRAVVIERGSVRYEGDFAALAADPALAAHYLAA